MNSQEAKKILILHRPGVEASDKPFVQALEQVQLDPELRRWFEQHCAFQSVLRDKFQQLPVPADLPATILAQKPVAHPAIHRRTLLWLAAAAAIALGVGLVFWWSQQRAPDHFTDYRARMVRTALRQYRMDLKTNDLAVVRHFLTTNGAPVDFVLPPGLERLSLTGGGLLVWRGNKVSMVCFDRGDAQMLFLFVVDRAAVKEPPSTTPELTNVNKLTTSSWTHGNRTYMLAGPDDSALFPGKF